MDLENFIKPNIEPIYIKTIYEQRQENLKNIFSDNGLFKKVENFSERTGYNETLIWHQLNDTNNLFPCIFIKDPAKQGIHQKIACEYISTFPIIRNMEQLPVSDDEKTLYCINGIIVKRKEIQDTGTLKSIDFHWQYCFCGKILDFYASHKYTNEKGGAQDNQFHDILEFHKEAIKCNNPNLFFFSITDGDYYKYPYQKYKNKIEYMNELYSGNRNMATTTNHLLNDMIPIICVWLRHNFSEDIIKEEISDLSQLLKICS